MLVCLISIHAVLAGDEEAPPAPAPPQADPAWIELRVTRMESPLIEVSTQARDELIRCGQIAARAVLPLLQNEALNPRILAIEVIRDTATRQLATHLVPLLEDPNQTIRHHTALALRDLFEQDFGYHPGAIPELRQPAVAAWHKHVNTWIAAWQAEQEEKQRRGTNGAPASQSPPPSAPSPGAKGDGPVDDQEPAGGNT